MFIIYSKKTYMIQIRQKKQLFHNQRRRQQLQNHFKRIRQKRYNKQTGKYQQQNEQQIMTFIRNFNHISNKQNQSLNYIRESNLISQLNKYSQKIIQLNNTYYKLCLLTIITNILKDDLNIDQRIIMFRISFKIFKSLNFSQKMFQQLNTSNEFIEISQQINVFEVLLYYFADIFIAGYSFEESDQEIIETQLYPAFLDCLFLSLNSNVIKIQSLQLYVVYVKKCIHNIFQPLQEMYEMGNRYKTKRNSDFFKRLIDQHLSYINDQEEFDKNLASIQQALFWLYNKLLDYYDQPQIQLIFSNNNKITIQLMFKTFKNTVNKKTQTTILQSLRTLMDKQVFFEEINLFLESYDKDKNMKLYYKVFQLLNEDSKRDKLITIQFLEGIVFGYCQGNWFKELFSGEFTTQVMTECIKQMQIIEVNFLEDNTIQKILISILQIIYSLIMKGNLKQKYKVNQAVFRLNSLGCMRKISQLSNWIDLNKQNYQNQENVEQILGLIEHIQSESFQFIAGQDDFQ